MLTLRGHHLICLVAFQGDGYSAAFARNFRRLKEIYLNKPAEKVKVIAGPDMACKKCPHLSKNVCLSPTDGPESKILALDKKALKILKINTGIYKVEEMHQSLRRLSKPILHSFCSHCSWRHKTQCQKVILDWIKR